MTRERPTPALVAIARSSHPGPTAAVTLVAVVLAVGIGLEPARVVAVGIVVLANQLSIGLSNDALDAARDRDAARTDKPVAAGELGAAFALRLAVALAAVSVLLSAFLGIGVLVANAVFLTAGWVYNAWLKRTPASPAAYLVGFAALPAIPVYAVDGSPSAPAWWATLAAALLGGAAHFGNVLPDLVDDRRAGIRGFPQLIGRTATVAGCFALLAASGVVLGIGLQWSALGVAAAVATVGIGVAGIVIGMRGAASRWLFRLVIAAALADVAALALVGDALLS